MYICKLRVDSTLEKKIERDIFEEDTGNESLFCQVNASGDKSYFAVCPACDNPIQIIGLYKKSERTDKPYGKHYPRSIPKLAEYNHEAYISAPMLPRRNLTALPVKKKERGCPPRFFKFCEIILTG